MLDALLLVAAIGCFVAAALIRAHTLRLIAAGLAVLTLWLALPTFRSLRDSPPPPRPAMTLMLFDVESVGLYGEAFAAAWLVHDAAGHEIDSFTLACHPNAARGDDAGRAWVAEHVMPGLTELNCDSPREVRDLFWTRYTALRSSAPDLMLMADVPFPVETNFLTACIADDPSRAVDAPYPLLDAASIRRWLGVPAPTYAHNPLEDCRATWASLKNAGTATVIDRAMAGMSFLRDG